MRRTHIEFREVTKARPYFETNIAVFLVAMMSMAFPSHLFGQASQDRHQIIERFQASQEALLHNEADKALKILNTAQSEAESTRDYLASAVAANLIGDALERQGKFQDALGSYEKGLRVIRDHQPDGIVAATLKALSKIDKSYAEQGSTPQSLDLNSGEVKDLDKLFSLSYEQSNPVVAIALMLNAGNMYLQQNQFKQTKLLYSQALAIANSANLAIERQRLVANVGWQSIKARQFDTAITTLQPLVSTLPNSEDGQLRQAILALGVALREEKRYEEAINNFYRALALYKEAGDERGERRTLAHLATAYLQWGKPQDARSYFLQALQLNEHSQDIETNWHANGGLAKTYLQLGNNQEALRHFESYFVAVKKIGASFATDQGTTSFLESHSVMFQEYASAAVRLAMQTGTYQNARKVLGLVRGCALETVTGRNNQRATGSKPGWLSLAYFEDVLFEKRECPETNQCSPHVPSPCKILPPSISSGDSTLPTRGITFLEYFVFPGETAITVKRTDGSIAMKVIAVGDKDMGDMVSQYRRTMSKEDADSHLNRLAQSLYTTLIQPIEQYLPTDESENVVIIPHDSLWTLPFAALVRADGTYFGDVHVLTYAPSEETWQSIPKTRPATHRDPRAWVIGNPAFPSEIKACKTAYSLEPLVGAQQEAESIAQLFRLHGQAELFTGTQADRLRLDAWHASFTVLHLATHGVICPDEPLRSFLALAVSKPTDLVWDRPAGELSIKNDPRLRIKLEMERGEAYTGEFPLPRVDRNGYPFLYPGFLDAWTVFEHYRLEADIVTLSACETGLGKVMGQGVIGFSRAFLAAGARSLLVSLWKVRDDSTQELFIEFYNEYLRHFNKGLALQKAMKRIRKNYQTPRVWAAFTLHGLAE